MGERNDRRLERWAIRARWPIPMERRKDLLENVASIMVDKALPPRDRIAAAKVILEADKVNVAASNLDLQKAKLEAGRSDVSLTVVDAMKEADRLERALDRRES